MSMACQESKRSDGPAPELPGIRGPWPSSDLGGGLRSHARETTTQTLVLRTPPLRTLLSSASLLSAPHGPPLQGNMSCVGRQGLCDYPKVRGGQ